MAIIEWWSFEEGIMQKDKALQLAHLQEKDIRLIRGRAGHKYSN